MFTCSICHFEFVLDDLALRREGGAGICLRCYERETGAKPPNVRPDVKQAINEEEGT